MTSMERKTKGLTRGEILVGMEQGVFKDGDKFENDSVGIIIKGCHLRYANTEDFPVECDALGYRYDLIDEPAFKVGDWVYEPGHGVYQINYKPFLDDLNACKNEGIRKATPDEIAAEKQRRWWAKLGRKVNEYRVGDVFFYKRFHEVRSTFPTGITCIDGYTHKHDEIRLVTPVEQRLDRSSNEEATD